MPITPILFSAVVSIVILHSYTETLPAALVLPLLAGVYLVFRFCDYCNKNDRRMLYILGLILVLAVVYGLVFVSSYDTSFLRWLVVDTALEDYILYFLALFIICCFAISSIVYYFTVIVYRALFIFMVLLIPFSINYTRLISVHAGYSIIAIGLYFALMILLGNKDFKNASVHVNAKYVYAFTSVICLAASLSFFVELPERARTQRIPDDFAITDISALFENNRFSGVADINQNNEEILFLVEAEEQLYLIRQIFVRYDGHRWEFDFNNELNFGPFDWEYPAESLNFDRLFDLALEADDASGLLQPLAYRGIIENLTNNEQIKTATIIPQGIHSSRTIPAPPRTFRLSGLSHDLRHVRNRMGEIFVADRGRAASQYSLTYYSDAFRGNQDFQNLAHIGADDFQNLLLYLAIFYDDSHPYASTIGNFRNELSYARKTAEYIHDFQSEAFTRLAAEITAGISGEYEKAAAIERFFLESGFKYDLAGDFAHVNEDVEHFLFQSRSGTCGHFATAMTLTARAAGLNARYVEGFTSTEVNEHGQYVVRAKHSHAFVQVFIPFYGWVTFDPTVSSEPGESGDAFAASSGPSFMIFFGFSLFLLLGFAGYLIFTRIIMEMLFRRKAARSSGRRGIVLIFGKALKLVKQELDIDNVSSAELTHAVFNKYGLDICGITTSFERTFFGNESISFEEKDEALRIYKLLYSCVYGKAVGRIVSNNFLYRFVLRFYRRFS